MTHYIALQTQSTCGYGLANNGQVGVTLDTPSWSVCAVTKNLIVSLVFLNSSLVKQCRNHLRAFIHLGREQ
jgi:hypothetical protein